jgi:DNA-binding helix-hairpin-helix protein with protein kinase domain
MDERNKLKRFEKHLVKCPLCGRDVLDHMKECPFCKGELEGSSYNGIDPESRNRIRKVLTVVFISAAVLIYLIKSIG